jgi:hypothetical protein
MHSFWQLGPAKFALIPPGNVALTALRTIHPSSGSAQSEIDFGGKIPTVKHSKVGSWMAGKALSAEGSHSRLLSGPEIFYASPLYTR